jgi:hypothetical protein
MGMLLGNGTLGAMVWGEGGCLRITLGRADFWDHRGGLPWDERQSYANIRRCLEAGDEKGLRALFEPLSANQPGQPARPSVLPVGRVELDFGPAASLVTGTLNLEDGTAVVRVRRGRQTLSVRIALDMERNAVVVQSPPALRVQAVRAVTAWGAVGEHLGKIGFQPPEMFGMGEDQRRDAGATLAGWTQMRPADATLCVLWRQRGREIAIAVEYGDDAAGARAAAGKTAAGALRAGCIAMRKRNARWWARYWRSAGAVSVPNANLQFLHDYGMYKFASFTNPAAVAASLQGPWIEDYQMPPWSSDYHFNINVQMCYWPAYLGNRLENLRPLWDMMRSWLPVLKHNAKVFVGIDDGLMLPHAVDDRGTCMGGFWTGSIDHACTAWMADMMFRYWRHTMDRGFLRETAWPFMVGAMRVYEAMLQREGEAMALPVSVSPEYRGAAMNAWGRNASFQLACIHRLIEDLHDAAAELGEAPSPAWADIAQRLPKASLIGPAGKEMIALWEGTPLEETHRHHSHLAGIVPFDTLDFADADTWGVIDRSIFHWIKMGSGLWSGWCIPWASMIHSRLGNAEAAELWLELWQKVFTNRGHGTLHNVDFSGFSLMGKGAILGRTRNEIMQMDAGMGAVTAIQEMLLHVRRGVNHVFRGAPAAWKNASFANFRTDGAFVVSAERKGGCVKSVTVSAPAEGGTFRLANPWPGRAAAVSRGRRRETVAGDTLEIRLTKGKTVRIEEKR